MPLRFVQVLAIAVAPLASLATGVAQTPSSASDEEFFESKVRPLLAERCFECHSSSARKVKGGLKLDTRADALAGGESGVAIVPGDPDASALIAALRYDGLVQMPPKGKLEEAQIAVFVEWIRRGAPYPETTESVNASGATNSSVVRPWSFDPVRDVAPPAVDDERWCRNEIDRFVLAGLEAAALAPAPEADRRTLLRRLSYDLTGLPPTEEEFASFENDRTPDAWERQIERLLASPHYGERWGRYWLDLARYSDSNGLDENLAMSNAWRYRDWVVRALNADLPYDRFLTWQLAGDLLPEPDDDELLRDQLTATGFLVLGPKMLAEQDKEKLVFDVVDEQMDVAFRAFQGLTLGCARCHDHKFDPITQRDYYALAGVFKSTATMGNLGFVSRWNERELARQSVCDARREHVAKTEQARKALADARRAAGEALSRTWTSHAASYLLAGEHASRAAIVVEAEEPSRGNLIADSDQYGSPEVVVARTGSGGLQFAEYDLVVADGGRMQLDVRAAALESRPMRVKLGDAIVAEAALGAITGSWNPDGQRWQRVATIDLLPGRNVLRFERDGAVPHLDKLVLAPVREGHDSTAWPLEGNPWADGLDPALVREWASFLQACARRDDAVMGLWKRFASLPEAEFAARAEALVVELRGERDQGKLAWNPLVLGLLDGLAPQSLRELAGRYQTLLSGADRAWREHLAAHADAKALDDAAQDALRKIVEGPASPFRLPAEELEASYTSEQRASVASLRGELEALEKSTPPMIDSAPGVRDAAEIADLRLRRRGNHLDSAGEPIPRGFVEALGTTSAPAVSATSSGRLELARWMLAPDHPLTARVAVNRVWQGHFGRGIVSSSSNFGSRGDAPTHPELLDWLARELVRRNWSLKSLHRLVCDSATYRMASDASPGALERDADNQRLSRQNRRRLDAEALRDTLLAVSGRLDRTIGGTLLETKNGDYVTNDQSGNAARYDAPRRSLYLPIIRNAMLDLFSSFDYPDPSVTVEARAQTTSASQALYLLNSPLALATARALAERTSTAESERERVDALYRGALARLPSDSERELALRFVSRARGTAEVSSGADVGRPSAPPADPETSARAWRALAQVLVVSNEILFVD